MGLLGSFLSLVFIFLILSICYYVIRIAVRHGIDSSELAKIIKENRHKE